MLCRWKYAHNCEALQAEPMIHLAMYSHFIHLCALEPVVAATLDRLSATCPCLEGGTCVYYSRQAYTVQHVGSIDVTRS